MKKIGMIAAAGCAVALCFALAGCGGSGTSTATSGAASGTTSGTTATATATSGTSTATSGTESDADDELVQEFAGKYVCVEFDTADGKVLEEDELADNNKDYELDLEEDGTFTVDFNDGTTMTGTWTPKDESTITLSAEGKDDSDITVDADGTVVMESEGSTIYFVLDE